MSYIRYFITFVCEAEGYGTGGRKPSGSCVLEARGNEGKLSCFAQNIKPETIYTVYMLFRDGGRYAGMPVGRLKAEPGGKAQTRFSFPADKILNGRFSLDECAAVAVLASRGAKPAAKPTAPLCGYRSTPFVWKRGFYDASVKDINETAAERKTVTAFETAPELLRPEPIEYAPEPLRPEPIEHAPEPLQPEPIEYAPEPLPPITDESESADLFSTSEPCPPAPEEAEPSIDFSLPRPEPPVQAKSSVPQPRREMSEIIDELFNKYQQEYPFRKQNRNAKWVKATLEDEIPAPLGSPQLFQEEFVRNSHGKFNHLLVGITESGTRRQFILGVPDNYSLNSRSMANALGFTQFKPQDDVRITRGLFGYWLMFINL